MATLIHKNTNQVIASQVLQSHNLFKRMKGLMGSKPISKDQVMWLKPCSSIHTYFMKFPIDAIFTDQELRVTGIAKNIPAWKIVNQRGEVMNLWQSFLSSESYSIIKLIRKYSVFEFAGGTLDNSIQVGDQIHVVN